MERNVIRYRENNIDIENNNKIEKKIRYQEKKIHSKIETEMAF